MRTVTVKPRTIAVDLTPLLPGGANGGAKIFVLQLVRGLAATAIGTDFILLTQFASHDELGALDGANVRRVMVLGPAARATARPWLERAARRVLPRLPGRLRVLLSRFAYDVNAFLKRGGSPSTLRGLGVDLLFCPFTAPIYHEEGIPTVCTIYDLQYKRFPDFFAPEDAALRGRTFTEACRQASALAAISDYSRDAAIEEGGLDPLTIRTIHLRLMGRVDRTSPSSPATLDALGLEAGRYLIYPANFWLHKNHEMLVTAFGIACSRGLGADVKLVCTGAPGPRADWIEEAVARLGLGARVVFPGYVADRELSALMASAGAMVFPSLYEGFGLPVIEAMSAGVPVACSDSTSLPEVAGDAALFFDPRIPEQIADAMTDLMGSEELRDRLIQAGRRRADVFADNQRMIDEYWTLFVEVVSRATPLAPAPRAVKPRSSVSTIDVH